MIPVSIVRFYCGENIKKAAMQHGGFMHIKEL